MKNLFSKDNFISSNFDANQKRQSIVINILVVVFFLGSSFTFFNALYCFSDILGSIVSGSADVAIKDLLRSLPIFLSFFMSYWALLLVHSIYRNVDDVRRVKSMLKNAICLLAFACFNFVYIIIGLITKTYLSLVEGSPSPFYPLDSILYSLIFVGLGVFVIIYLMKLKDRIPYAVPSRGPIVKKARGLYCTFMALWSLFALFGFSSGLYSIFIYDFAHEYAFYGIGLILIFLLSPILLAFWQFFYNNLKEEKRKELLLPMSIISLCVSVVFIALYFISLGTNMDAPSNAGFGMLPVAFSASVNIATLLTVLVPLIVSITALIKGLLLRKSK